MQITTPMPQLPLGEASEQRTKLKRDALTTLINDHTHLLDRLLKLPVMGVPPNIIGVLVKKLQHLLGSK